ncbi:MAG: sugar-binding transcriptional regulator [Burkholderiales bacterium]|nr:sugar-binding transcriptional regulator [Burkholderiales bacterium]MCE7876435.1 sugar-binding transcriptional regulator [Betaproteobacteria bacterium PRO3]
MRRSEADPPDSSAQADLGVRAAWLYYVEELTQAEIARALGLSRAKVIRLLSAARERGVVRVELDARDTAGLALERRLVERYRLELAIVAPSPTRESAVADVVGHAAGTWLSREVREGMTLGIGWGRTLHASLAALRERTVERLSVVSLLGGMTHSHTVNPSAVARRVADALGAECYQLTAPLVVSQGAMRDALWKEPGLNALLERARKADLAIVSVGDLSADATLFREGLLPRAALRALAAAGAVGDVLGHFIDAGGRVVDHPVNRRVVAVGIADLRKVPRIAVAAGGRRKAAVIDAALRATGARILVTDEGAARALVDSRGVASG